MKKDPSRIRMHSFVDLCFFCVFSLGQIFLMALAVILILMLVWNQKSPVYEIPLPVSRYIQTKSIEKGYRLEWTDAQWGLSGQFRFRNLKVYSRDHQGALIFDAEVLRGRLGLSFFASSGIPLRSLTVEGGQVYPILIDSFSLSRKPVLTQLSARLLQTTDRIELDPIQFKFADIVVSLTGAVQPRGSLSALGAALRDQFLGTLGGRSGGGFPLSETLGMLGMGVKDGRLSLDFESAIERGLSLDASFLSAQTTFPGQGGVRDLALRLSRNDSIHPGVWNLEAKSLNGFFRQDVQFQGAQGQAVLRISDDGVSLEDMSLLASRPWLYGYALDFLNMDKARYESFSLEGDVSLSALDSLASGRIRIHDLRRGNGEISGLLHTRLENLVSWIPYDITIPLESDYIQVYTNYLPFWAWKCPKVGLRLWGRQLSVNHTSVDYLRLGCTYENQRLSVSDLSYRAGACSGEGEGSFDFKDQSYRLDLHGSLWPHSLNSWFPGWWSRLFEDIRFGAVEPFADAVIEGRWKAPFNTSLSIYVEGREVRYHGVPFDQGSLGIYLDQDYVRLKHIRARRDAYVLDANVDIGRRSAGRRDSHFEVDAFYPLSELGTAFGLHFLDPIWKDVQVDGGVKLSLVGALNHLSEGKFRGVFSGDFDQQNSVNIYGFDFDRLKGRFYTDLNSIQFSQLQGSLSGGAVKGRVMYGFENRLLELGLNLRNCRWQELMTVIKGFKPDVASKKKEDEVPSGGTVKKKKGNQGKLDVAGELSLVLGEDPLTQLSGKGTWELRDPALATIHLLGGLSRLLEDLGVGLGAFSLEKAKGQYLFNGPVMTLNDIVLTGPALTVEANGQCDLKTEKLKGNAKLFLMETEEVGLMTLFATLLKPLGHVLEVLIHGSLVEPEWRFKLDPRNLVSSPSQDNIEASGATEKAGDSGSQ